MVEIHSPIIALIDLGRKKAAYEQFGMPAFWVMDLRVTMPSLTVFELVDGRYQQTARVNGDEPRRALRPFPVEVIPSALVAGLATRGRPRGWPARSAWAISCTFSAMGNPEPISSSCLMPTSPTR